MQQVPGNASGPFHNSGQTGAAGLDGFVGTYRRRQVRVLPALAQKPGVRVSPPMTQKPGTYVAREALWEFERQVISIITDLASVILLLPAPRAREVEPPVTTRTIEIDDMRVRSSATSGDVVPVFVRVRNRAEYPQEVELQLTDMRENVIIGRRSVRIPPRSSRTVSFSWHTRGTRLGDHNLDARAIVLPRAD